MWLQGGIRKERNKEEWKEEPRWLIRYIYIYISLRLREERGNKEKKKRRDAIKRDVPNVREMVKRIKWSVNYNEKEKKCWEVRKTNWKREKPRRGCQKRKKIEWRPSICTCVWGRGEYPIECLLNFILVSIILCEYAYNYIYVCSFVLTIKYNYRLCVVCYIMLLILIWLLWINWVELTYYQGTYWALKLTPH